MMVVSKMPMVALVSAMLTSCSDPQEGPGVLPENMAEENLPAVETVREEDRDADVRATDVGADAVAVRTGE